MTSNIELDKDSLESYQFFQEIIQKSKDENKKEFKFKEGRIIMSGKDIIYQLDNGQKKYFLDGSKIIYFTNDKEGFNRKPFFIHDQTSLDKALKITKIENGILKGENDNLKEKENYDSNNSGRSDGSASSVSSINSLDINEILQSSYNLIEEPKQIKVAKILNEQRFKERFNIKAVSSLDFNFKYLKEDYIDNNIDYIDTQNDWCDDLKNLPHYNNTKSYCFIFGPKGTGKTTLLLKYLNVNEIPRLYFSLKIMSKPGFINKKWKKYSLLETIYTFDNLEQMDNFSQTKIQDISNSPYLMKFIKSYIELIMDFYSKNNIKKEKKIWIVIDDYNQDLYDNESVIEQIINYVNKNKDKLFLCILGDGRYMNKKFYQYYSNENTDFFGMYWNQSIGNNNSKKKKILQLPKYYYKYKDSKDISEDEKKVKENIGEAFKKIKLKSFLFLSKFMDSTINIKEFKDDIINLPLEFLTCYKDVDEDKNISIKFSFNSEIYKNVFDETIKGLLKIDSLKTKMIIFKEEDIGKDGVEFQDIIVEQLWNNTFDYIVFPENNKLKVQNIFELKFNENDVRTNLDIKKPIIIRQDTFGGKYYDLLVIIDKNDKKYAIFIQIGLNKRGIDINTYLNNLIDNNDNYKKGIETLIGYKIDELGFLLIFEYKHQKALLERKNKTEGVGFCTDNNLDFLIYKNFMLFKEVDDSEPIKSIDVTEKTLIFEYNEETNHLDIDMIRSKFSKICQEIASNQSSDPIIPLNDDEKGLILKSIKTQFLIDYDELKFGFSINAKENKGFKDFGEISSDSFNQVSVFINNTNRYFSYNNEIFQINQRKIQKMEKKKIEEEFNWDIYFLKKKRKEKKRKKK